METIREVRVTLSNELIEHLRNEAARLDVPLEYLVIGLLVDTRDQLADSAPRQSASCEQAA